MQSAGSKRRWIVVGVVALTIASACMRGAGAPSAEESEQPITPAQATDIAEEAYVYAFPMMESYRRLYAQAVDRTAPEYEGSFNELSHQRRLPGPEDGRTVRPDHDTLHSLAWLDLRAQPVVISVPEIEGRYFSIQLVDMFTRELAHIGTQTTGTKGGAYVVAGSDWLGPKPEAAEAVLRSDSDFVHCMIQTEVRGPDDVANVAAIQDRYRLTPLNVFLGRPSAPEAPGITFPSYVQSKVRSAGFIDLFDFLLQHVRTPAEEADLMERFSAIGARAGALSASLALTPELRRAIDAGIGQGIVAISRAAQDPGSLEGVTVRAADGWSSIVGLTGHRHGMRDEYLVRAVGAALGVYGNLLQDVYSASSSADESGEPLDGSKLRYFIRFNRAELPPVDAFWSLTMYSLPDQRLVSNPISRYSIGDRSELRYGADGSLTIYIQHEAPSGDRRSNWLPAPHGPFSVQLRMYLPKLAASDPVYLPPPVRVVR